MPESFKDKLKVIVQLQKIESESGVIRDMLTHVPDKIETLDAKLNEWEKAIEDETATIDELRKQYRSHESDIQENNQTIRKNQDMLKTVKTNKEYQMALKGIDDLKAKNAEIEDLMLNVLDQIEAAEKSVAQKSEELSSFEKEIRDEKNVLKKKEDQGKKELQRLNANWEKISKSADSELMKSFLFVKEQVRGVAITPVRNAVCQGCNMNIPPQIFNEIQRFDKLYFCPHCQRIIYWEKAE